MGFRVERVGFGVQVAWSRVHSAGSRDLGSGFRVQVVGVRGGGVGSRVEGARNMV
jgi:hypothetical protein